MEMLPRQGMTFKMGTKGAKNEQVDITFKIETAGKSGFVANVCGGHKITGFPPKLKFNGFTFNTRVLSKKTVIFTHDKDSGISMPDELPPVEEKHEG